MLSREQAQLKLDFDTEEEPSLSLIFLKLRRAGYAVRELVQRRSPSKRGWHVLVNVEPQPRTAMEVVALQAICGSDPWREAMQVQRAHAMAKRSLPAHMRDAWNVLYQADSRRERCMKF